MGKKWSRPLALYQTRFALSLALLGGKKKGGKKRGKKKKKGKRTMQGIENVDGGEMPVLVSMRIPLAASYS